MSDEELIDVTVNLDKETAKIINDIKKKTKKDIIEIHLLPLILRNKIQDETIERLEAIEQNLIRQLEEGIELRKRAVAKVTDKLRQSEEYNEQGRAMIKAIMERWYNYD